MITAATLAHARRRSGITLTEILIALLILSVGLVSLATLFPIGLLRLRDAARYSRSTYLAQSANADISSRNLLSGQSFVNTLFYNSVQQSGLYNPLLQDTPYFNADWAADQAGPGAYAASGGLGPPGTTIESAAGSPQTTINGVSVSTYPTLNGPGLPFAYDPLWGLQTGYYPPPKATYEARFGAGLGFIRSDPFDNGNPSAHGLQRITNLSTALASISPSIFVSPEDVVWQEPANTTYNIAPNSVSIASGLSTPPVGPAPSPILPDMSISYDSNGYPLQTNDFHYSWLFTGQLVNASNQACFDGNIVVFENRPFGISLPGVIPNAPASPLQSYLVDGETVVEAIFGHSGNIQTPAGANAGYAAGAARTVLLRWYASMPDPVVKAGDWIADVTYERQQTIVQSRWWQGNTSALGIPNPTNNAEWDNLPPQRCFWYQVQKALPVVSDPYLGATYRSMVVYVNQNLQSRTLLTAVGTPYSVNAALIAPSVVNVIPTTIFTR